jgi:uncharacterized damage-inducible protein DinB
LRDALLLSLPIFTQTAHSFPESLRHQKPSPLAFSATEIVYHMLSVEELWQGRMQKLVDGESGDFQALDPNADANEHRFNDRDHESGIHALELRRHETVNFLDGLTSEELLLEGNHSKYGPMSILRILEIMAGHDRNHAAQLERTLAAITGTQIPVSSSSAA